MTHETPNGHDASRPLPRRLGPPQGPESVWADSHATALDLQQVGSFVRRRRGTIMAGAATVMAVVVVATSLWPKTYESSASILVEEHAAALEVLERLSPGSHAETEIELIRSRRVIAAVVDELDLHVTATTDGGPVRPADVLDDFEADRDATPRRIELGRGAAFGTVRVTDAQTGRFLAQLETGEETNLGGIRFRIPENGVPDGLALEAVPFGAAVASVRSRLDVSKVQRDADLIQLTCQAGTATGAHRLCAAVSRSYMQLRTELQRTEATATVTFLRDQVMRLGQQLAAAEDELEAYTRDNDVVGLDQRASEEVRHVAQLRAQREQLDVERAALVQFVAQIESQDTDPSRYRDLASFPTLLANHAFTRLLVDLVDLEGRRSDLAVRRTERDPELAALDARITDAYGQLRAMAESHENSLEARIRSLDGTLRDMGQRLRAIPAQQIQTARLERQAGLLDDLYRMLETRLREAEVAEAIDLPSVDIVDAASFPLAPASPRMRNNLLLGALLGLVYGGLLAGFREFQDRRIHGPHEVERRTGLPVLGMIPRLREPGPVLTMVLPAQEVADTDVDQPRALAAAGASRPRGPMLLDPREGIALRSRRGARRSAAGGPVLRQEDELMALESFHGLASDLRLAGQRLGREARSSVAITSASRGEGKTFTACNLALVCAAHGARTLLIDADMRAGTIARFFDLPPTDSGLSDALAGGSNIRDEWRGMRVHQSELWVIPAGTPTPHSSGLLSSPRFDLLLARAEEEFDQIVIDTPPLGLITDAATVAPSVDSIMLVVREGVTERELLDRSLERLARANGTVLGIVLNAANLEKEYSNLYEYSA